MPLLRTMTTTRINGIAAPPLTRKMVWSGDFVDSMNVSWKTLAACVSLVTCTETSASITSRGIGTGTPGPIINCRTYGASDIGKARDAFRQRQRQAAADGVGQVGGSQRAVRVTDPPEELGVAEILRGDVIEAFALRHRVRAEHRQRFGLRHEAAPDVDDRDAVDVDPGGRHARVAARRAEDDDGQGLLERKNVDHGSVPTPS